MAAYTSTQTGNWSATATWGGSGPPGIGDTANVYHAITVTADVTLGLSGAGNGSTDMTILGPANSKTGALTINSGVTFRMRGLVNHNNATITVAAGGTWMFDGTAAGTPSGTSYRIAMAGGAKVAATGSSGSHAIITSDVTGGSGKGYIAGGQIDVTYCDFSNLLNIQTTLAAGQSCSYVNSTFTGCGACINSAALLADAVYQWNACTWTTSTASTGNINLGNQAPAAITSGTRLITACVFDQQPTLYAPADFTITNNVFVAGVIGQSSNAGKWASFDGNLVYSTVSASVSTSGDVKNNFVIINGAVSNPHFLAVQVTAFSQVVDGNIFDFSGTDDTGDCILSGTSGGTALGSSCTLTITKNIVLPNSSTGSCGTLFTCWGASNSSVSVEHNTYCTGGQAATVGETYNGYAGMLTSAKSNLAWNSGATAGSGVFRDLAASHVTDIVSSANMNYNGRWNITTPYQSFVFSSGSPGGNDVTGNPTFVDSTRNMKTWDTYKGGAGTIASALTRIKADPTLTKNDLIPWIRNGFAPKNTAFKGTAHDATDIGAVPWVATSPIAILSRIFMQQSVSRASTY